MVGFLPHRVVITKFLITQHKHIEIIKMKLKILALLFVFISTSAIGQTVRDKAESLPNTVFVEALGIGFLGSINYERRLSKKPYLTARAGMGFYTESSLHFTLPIAVQYLFELKQNHFIETGVGYTWAQFGADDCFFCDGTDNTANYSNIYLSVGYRKHFANNWMWKVNFSPLITNNHGENFKIWFGASFGKRF